MHGITAIYDWVFKLNNRKRREDEKIESEESYAETILSLTVQLFTVPWVAEAVMKEDDWMNNATEKKTKGIFYQILKYLK